MAMPWYQEVRTSSQQLEENTSGIRRQYGAAGWLRPSWFDYLRRILLPRHYLFHGHKGVGQVYDIWQISRELPPNDDWKREMVMLTSILPRTMVVGPETILSDASWIEMHATNRLTR